MTLYELTADYRDFLALAEAGEIPEDAVDDTLDAIAGEIHQKIDAIACIVKNSLAEAEAIKHEIDALTVRMKQKKALADRLKAYIMAAMQALGEKKMETARSSVMMKTTPPAITIADVDALIAWANAHGRDDLLIYRVPEPSKTQIKTALAAGEEIPGCAAVSGVTVIIK